MLSTTIYHIWKERNVRAHNNNIKINKEQMWTQIENNCIILLSKCKRDAYKNRENEYSPSSQQKKGKTSLAEFFDSLKKPWFGKNQLSSAAIDEPCTYEERPEASRSSAALKEPRTCRSVSKQNDKDDYKQAKCCMSTNHENNNSNNQKVTSFISNFDREEERNCLQAPENKGTGKEQAFLHNKPRTYRSDASRSSAAHGSPRYANNQRISDSIEQAKCFMSKNFENYSKNQKVTSFSLVLGRSEDCISIHSSENIIKGKGKEHGSYQNFEDEHQKKDNLKKKRDNFGSDVQIQSKSKTEEIHLDKARIYNWEIGETSYDSKLGKHMKKSKKKVDLWKPP